MDSNKLTWLSTNLCNHPLSASPRVPKSSGGKKLNCFLFHFSISTSIFRAKSKPILGLWFQYLLTSRGWGRGGVNGEEGGKVAEWKDLDQTLGMCLVSARLETGCYFPFFVLFNIKHYLLYWELQRLLSNDMRFSQAHIKFPYKILPSACLLFVCNWNVSVLRNTHLIFILGNTLSVGL